MEKWLKLREGISEEKLDEYLSKGWFRVRQSLFTTNRMFENPYTRLLFWLRVNISIFRLGKTQKRIYKKNISFSVEIAEWRVNQEIEDLWQKYQSSVDFFTLGSVSTNLFNNSNSDTSNVFNTKMITIRDNGRLIAVGYFDIASNSIAAILHFYDPDYRSYSLGKYLMLLEIDYARNNSKQFYYTGYIGIGITKFDYKLSCDINATEVYIPEDDEWVLWNTIGKLGLEKKFFDGIDEDILKELDNINFN